LTEAQWKMRVRSIRKPVLIARIMRRNEAGDIRIAARLNYDPDSAKVKVIHRVWLGMFLLSCCIVIVIMPG